MEKNEETLYFRPHLRGILHTTGQQHLLIVLALLHTFGGKTSYLSRGSEVCFLQNISFLLFLNVASGQGRRF